MSGVRNDEQRHSHLTPKKALRSHGLPIERNQRLRAVLISTLLSAGCGQSYVKNYIKFMEFTPQFQRFFDEPAPFFLFSN
jgi:hypothetical protein